VGRQPLVLHKMLWLHFLQQWFGLADEALEDSVSDSQAMREFVWIDMSREEVPDATTVLRFRRLLEANGLT
jgi:IS5 family transposase